VNFLKQKRAKMRPRIRSMFARRGRSYFLRALAGAFVSFFIGTFLLASQPRARNFFVSNLADRESKLLSAGAFFDGVIASRSPKCADTQCEIRLSTGRVWNDPYKRNVFLRATDRSIVLYGVPTAGSFLIRSPPSLTLA